MRNKITALVLSILFIIPCALRAEEVEIQLMEVIEIGNIPGDDPLDDPIQYPGVPTRPYGHKLLSGTGPYANISGLNNGTYTLVAESATSSCQTKFVK